MAKVRVKINSKAAVDLMNSGPVQEMVLREAQQVAGKANDALKPRSQSAGRFEADVQPGKSRAHALVKTKGVYPARHNAKHNTLLKALNSG